MRQVTCPCRPLDTYLALVPSDTARSSLHATASPGESRRVGGLDWSGVEYKELSRVTCHVTRSAEVTIIPGSRGSGDEIPAVPQHRPPYPLMVCGDLVPIIITVIQD